MKNKVIILFVLLALIISGALTLYLNRSILFTSPLKSEVELSNISKIDFDLLDNTYIIANSKASVYKFDSENVLKYEIKDLEKVRPYLIQDIAVCPEGFLYLLVDIFDYQGRYVEEEKVLAYTSNGKYHDTLIEYTYAGEEKPMGEGDIGNLLIEDNILSFPYKDKNELYMYSKDISNKKSKINKSFLSYLSDEVYIYQILARAANGQFFITTHKGELYEINPAGSINLLYPLSDDDNGKNFPIAMKYADDKLYFIDFLENNINVIDFNEDSQSIRSILLEDDNKPFENLPSLRDFHIMNDQILMASTNSIIKTDLNNWEIIKSIELSIQEKVKQIMVWIILLLFIMLCFYLFYFVYVHLMEGRTSIIIKQISIFVPIIILAMCLLAALIYNHFVTQDDNQIFEKLVLLTSIAQQSIDSEDLESLTSPRDFMNENYQSLLAHTIEAQLKTGGKMIDGEGLYSTIYKYAEGNLYEVVDYNQTINMFKPIDIEGEFKEVLEVNDMIIDKARDENGYWMFAMAPIHNEKGEIIGIYETGVDYYGVLSQRNILQKNIAGMIVIANLVIILIFVLITLGVLSSIRRLNTSVSEMAQGNFYTEIADFTSKDEVANLANSFKLMQNELKKHIQTLTETVAAKERIESELSIASDIQMSLVPKTFPAFPNYSEFDLYALMEAAREVGGDFYDFFMLDEEKICFVMADVSGKGVPAALFMAVTRTFLRAFFIDEKSPAQVLETINNELIKENDACMFVTMFCGSMNLITGICKFANAGHNIPYIIRNTGKIEEVEKVFGVAVGVVEDITYGEGECKLNKGDSIFLFTDGVTEAENKTYDQYGEERLVKLLESLVNQRPDSAIKIVREDVFNFANGAEQSDDITMLMIKYYGDKE